MKKVRKVTQSNALDFLKTAIESPRGKYAIKATALARYIEQIKTSDNFKQKEIADNLEMAESQLSKWLSGFHNLTLQSILKLESASNIEILNPSIWDGTSLEKKNVIITQAQEVKIPGTDIIQEYVNNNSLYQLAGESYIASANPVKKAITKPSGLVIAMPMRA